MQGLRDFLDQKVAPLFEGEDAKFHKLHALYEAPDTFLFTPGERTSGKGSHVRDNIDLKRMMITVVVALIPACFMAMWNTGYQANLAVESGALVRDDFNTAIYAAMGMAHDSSSLFACLLYGALYFVPIFAVTGIVGGNIEGIFSVVRKHEINEGFLVTLFLFPLTLPATIPLWQVALGIAFGVVVGKEMFGGTGMNILNPALTGRAFLFFAYPAQISGDMVWTAATADKAAVDGWSGATWLGRAAAEHGVLAHANWWDAFLGTIPGSMGETSALGCLIGATVLVIAKVASWRTLAGVFFGTAIMATVLNVIGSETNPMFAVPWYWHVVLGGWAFGAAFMATEPVTSCFTDRGRVIYGFLIGVLVVLVRVVNPAYPEGMMLAILFMNLFAPFIDHFVVQANVKRRAARYAA